MVKSFVEYWFIVPSNPDVWHELFIGLIFSVAFAGIMMIVMMVLLHMIKKDAPNWEFVGEKKGRAYYQHKTLRKRTFRASLSGNPDLDWLKFRKDVL